LCVPDKPVGGPAFPILTATLLQPNQMRWDLPRSPTPPRIPVRRLDGGAPPIEKSSARTSAPKIASTVATVPGRTPSPNTNSMDVSEAWEKEMDNENGTTYPYWTAKARS
jgi:hypothetical protein